MEGDDRDGRSRDHSRGRTLAADLPVAERVADLLARMTVEEKAQQLVGY